MGEFHEIWIGQCEAARDIREVGSSRAPAAPHNIEHVLRRAGV